MFPSLLGGIFYALLVSCGELFLDEVHICEHNNLTNTGEGREHGPRPRVPSASPGERSPQVPSSASRKPLGAGKHATAGKGKRGWPRRRGPRKNGRVRHGRPKGGGRWRRERRTGGRQLRAARETKTLSDFTPPPDDRGREWNRKTYSREGKMNLTNREGDFSAQRPGRYQRWR